MYSYPCTGSGPAGSTASFGCKLWQPGLYPGRGGRGGRLKSLYAWYTRAREKLRTIAADHRQRVSLLVVAGIAGMLLVGVSEWLPAAEEKPRTDTRTTQQGVSDSYADALETRLENLISATEGAGRALVMVTLEAGQTTQYAADEEQSADSRRREPVRVGDTGLVEEIRYPRVLGVAVVCEGGDDPGVQCAVTELVDALTDVGAHHITVTKMHAN